MGKLLASLLLLSTVPLAHAQDIEKAIAQRDAARVQNTLRFLTRAFNREAVKVDEVQLRQVSAVVVTTAVEAADFKPPVHPALSHQWVPVDQDRATLCLRYEAQNEFDLATVLYHATRAGMFASSPDCAGLAPAQPVTGHWPRFVWLQKTIDRRDSPVPTLVNVVNGLPVFTGVEPRVAPEPTIKLKAKKHGGGEHTISVSNPVTFLEGTPEFEAATVSLTSIEVRSPFDVAHTCNELKANQSCEIRIGYDGDNRKPFTGSARIEFSNGTTLFLGLAGLGPVDWP